MCMDLNVGKFTQLATSRLIEHIPAIIIIVVYQVCRSILENILYVATGG